MDDAKAEDLCLGHGLRTPHTEGVGSLARILAQRELAGSGALTASVDETLIAEERLLNQPEFAVTSCRLNGPVSTKSAYLVVFSPDRSLMASTHGDHAIYICRVQTGQRVRTLQGHPRTPWCVAFHPSRPGVLASGCLSGQVRVWDLYSGASDMWKTERAVAGLSFHPSERVLAVATVNEVYFWDWSQPEPFTKVKTRHEQERVRFVQFDHIGHHLVTGITNYTPPNPPTPERSRESSPSRVSVNLLESGRFRPPLRHVDDPGLNGGGPLSVHDVLLLRQRRRNLLSDSDSSPNQSPVSLVNLSRRRADRDETWSTTASIGSRGSPPPATMPSEPVPRSTPATPALTNSASQTLSDLAQAASNQLIAENERLLSGPTSNSALLDQSYDRDDPLLSDRPYGQSLPTRSGSRPTMHLRNATEPNQTIRPPLGPSLAGQRSARIDHNYVMRSNRSGNGTSANLSSGRELDLRMTFSHSPESEFVEVARPLPSNVRNPSLEADTPSRILSQRERRLETLLDERRALVNEIQQMRTTREILFPNPDDPALGHVPSPSSLARLSASSTSRETASRLGQEDPLRAGITVRTLNERLRRPPQAPRLPDRRPFRGGGGSSEPIGLVARHPPTPSSLAVPLSISIGGTETRDHPPGFSRPIDEWAVNQRLAIESSRLAQSLSSELGTEASDVLRLSNDGNNVPSSSASTSNTVDPDPVERLSLDVQLELLRSRRRERLLRMSLRRGALNELNRIYDDDGSPTVLNESDAVRAAEPTVETPPSALEVPTTSQQSQSGTRESSTDQAPEGPDEPDSGRSGSQNLDIALLSRHIDHMQRICRESLSGIIPRQRRQILRLQSIRRMLEDLQVQIRNLRAASIQELQRRQDRLSSDLQAKQRISLALNRLGNAARRSPRLPATARGAANLGTRRPNPPTDLESAVNNSTSAYRNRSLGQLRKSLTRSSTLRARAQCQVASQMRASLRAVQLGPDLARQANSPLSQIKAQASLDVLEKTSKDAGCLLPNSSQGNKEASTAPIEPLDELDPTITNASDMEVSIVQDSRSELRAFSQRLERLLRTQRETAEQGRRGSGGSTRDYADRALEVDDTAAIDDVDPLLGLPRPTTYMSYRQRFRHLFEGTSEYSGLLENDPETLDRGTMDRASGEGFFASSSESESDSDPTLSGYGLPYSGNNVDNLIRMEHMGLSRRGPTSRTFRNSLRDWSDARVGLRRHAERERRRLSRERDLIRRRHRYGRYFADSEFFPGTNEPPQTLQRFYRDPLMNQPPSSSGRNVSSTGNSENSNTVSPLREQIWRRLRRRNAQLNQLNSQIMAETGNRDWSRHREFLSGLVDQLTIDQPPFSSSFHSSNDVDNARESTNDNIPIANNDSLSLAMNSSQRPNQTPYSDASNNRASSPGGRMRGLPDQLRYRNYSHMLILGRRDAAGIGPFSLRIEDGIETGHMLATNRIQAWNFSRGQLPDISDTTSNLVVKEACIVSSASVDISEDNTLLVTLTPTYAPMTTAVGVYSLKADSRGQCLASLSVESSVVSVSLSPTSRHLLVGLNRQTRRLPSSGAERGLMAHIYRIQFPWERDAERGRLIHKRDIAQLETSALNCIRWIPTPGQGMAYATNTGLIKLLR